MPKIKRTLLIMGLIVLIVIVSIGCFLTNCYYKTWCAEGYIDNQLTTYTSNKMTQYEGGEEAQHFFAEYANANNALQIYFHYQDNRMKSNFFHEYQSFFLLDITYSPEEYRANKKNLDPSAEFTIDSEEEIVYQEKVDDICKAIFANDVTNTMRYILFFGNVDTAVSVESLIAWNVSV